MKQAVASFQGTNNPPATSAMETDEPESKNPALPDIIRDLKTDIATIAQEMRHLFNQCPQQRPKRNHSMELSPEISELIDELKQDIATIALEMRAKFAQQATLNSTNQPQRKFGT